MRYTPDFYVPQKNPWYEIKAFSRDPHFLVKADLFRQTEARLIIFWQGEIERLIRLSARLIFRKYERFNITDKAERKRLRMLINQKAKPRG